MSGRLLRSASGAGRGWVGRLLPPTAAPLTSLSDCARGAARLERQQRRWQPHRSSSHRSSSSFSAFAVRWNDALRRRPQESVACFLSAQSTTWLMLYAALSASPISLPPELAAGWMVARLTKKFRQPANALLAAGMIKAVPSLGKMKVTPLVTGFAADANTRTHLGTVRRSVEGAVPGAKGAMDAAVRGAAWLEGPVDKYGLAFYLSGKITSLSTMWAAAYLVHQGFDVQGILSSWGLGEGVGMAAGTIAGAATCNAFLTPLHFFAVVGGVNGMEDMARAFRRAAPAEVLEEFREKRRAAEKLRRRRSEGYDGTSNSGWEEGQNEKEQEEEEETAEEFFENRFIDIAKLALLLYTLAVSLCALELMKETATGEEDSGDERREKSGNISG